MSSPYIVTVLNTIVTLSPNQFDNNIYIHLKNNLIRLLEGRCYRNYGYVSKIYEILKRNNGEIVPEFPSGSASFDIKFSCKLCYPLINKHIICKVERINQLIIKLVNGPIQVIATISPDRMNKDVFFTDQNKNLRYKIGDKSQLLTPDTFVKIKVVSKTFNDTDTFIIVMGYLENIATRNEIEKFYNDEYEKEYDKTSKKMVDFDEYAKLEEDTDVINDPHEEPPTKDKKAEIVKQNNKNVKEKEIDTKTDL